MFTWQSHNETLEDEKANEISCSHQHFSKSFFYYSFSFPCQHSHSHHHHHYHHGYYLINDNPWMSTETGYFCLLFFVSTFHFLLFTFIPNLSLTKMLNVVMWEINIQCWTKKRAKTRSEKKSFVSFFCLSVYLMIMFKQYFTFLLFSLPFMIVSKHAYKCGYQSVMHFLEISFFHFHSFSSTFCNEKICWKVKEKNKREIFFLFQWHTFIKLGQCK